MTGNAANDPKVAYDLGEGGAPQEAQDRMHSLVDEYNDVGSRLKTSGLNGDVLSLAPRIVNQEP